MTHRGDLVTDAAWEEAHAFDAARTSYHAWHWAHFKRTPDPPKPPRGVSPPPSHEERYPKRFGICPRCGVSRHLGPGTRQNPLSPCRTCQKALLPLVPKEHRRRGFATTEGFTIAFATERESRHASTGSPTRRRRVDDPERKRRERAERRRRDPEGTRRNDRERDARRRAKQARHRDTD